MFRQKSARRMLLDTLPKLGCGAEVGVFRGDFSAELLRLTKPRRLHLIDPWLSVDDQRHSGSLYGAGNRSQADMDRMHDEVLRRFASELTVGRMVVHRARSASALATLPDRSLDWAYIDGDHTYDHVMSDLRLSAVKVKLGGFICGDDYTDGGWWKDDVIRAVHDFLHEAQSHVEIKFVNGTQWMLLNAKSFRGVQVGNHTADVCGRRLVMAL